MKLFFRKKLKQDLQAGIGLHPDGITVAVIKQRMGQRPLLQSIRFHPYTKHDSHAGVCRQLAAELDLRSMKSVLVLSPGDYTMLQVESPGVEPSELRGAVRWQIKDLIDFHIDDAVIDLFSLPESKRAGIGSKLSVVAARNSLIRDRVDLLGAAGIEIEAIDITELSLRNLTLLDETDEGAHAFLYLSSNCGMIEIINNSQLYLSRQIKFDLSDLQNMDGNAVDFGQGNPVLDTLVLEIQRSMDFYESQFGEGPVKQVSVMSTDADRVKGLVQFAEENLEASVGEFRLVDMLDGMESAFPGGSTDYMAVVGGALRGAV